MKSVSRWSLLWIALALGLAFSNSLNGEYHLDSIYRVQQNGELDHFWPPHRHFLDPATSATLPTLVAYRPMLPLSLSANLAISRACGIDPLVGYHLGNVLIHIGATWLLFRVLTELLTYWRLRSEGDADPSQEEKSQALSLALAGSLIFGLHPVAGVPVNYLCGRDVTLMLGFLLLSFLSYLRWRRLGGVRRISLALLFALVALMSKTNAVAMPALVFVFEITAGRQRLASRAAWMRTALATLPVLLFFFVTEGLLGFSDRGQVIIDRDPFEYPLTEFRVHLFYYLRNLIWPFEMRALPHIEAAKGFIEGGVLLGIAFAIGSAAFVLLRRAQAPLATFAVAAYWTMFMPTSSFMPFRSFAADYRQVPSLAFGVLLLVVLVEQLVRGRARTLVFLSFILAAGASTLRINRHWQTEEALWEQSVRYGGSALAHMNYAVAVRSEQPALAEAHLMRTLALVPTHIFGHLNLGLLWINDGRVDEGIALLDKAAGWRPDWAVVHHWRGIGLEQAGKPEDALAASRRAVQLDPDHADYLSKRNALLYSVAREKQVSGVIADSVPFLKELHSLVRAHRDSRFLSGFALQHAGDQANSRLEYEIALDMQPEHAQALFNHGFACMKLADHEAAIVSFERALVSNPQLTAAHAHVATSYRALQRDAEAEPHEALYREAQAKPA
ncbi:MAG: tetratricopeptide (TPR) repeat protein, partial [Planctomycetota bacterium]